MTNYKSLGKALNINILLAQQAEIAAELKKMEPMLEEVEKLNKAAALAALTIIRYKAENGGCTPEELFELQYSASNPEVFASLIVWLERITRSGQITLNYGPTFMITLNNGTIDFPYLFVIDLKRGVTPALIEDITAIFLATSTPSNPDDILFRIASDSLCLVMKNTVGENPTRAYVGGIGVDGDGSYIAEPLKEPLSFEEVFIQIQEFTKMMNSPVKRRRKFFGLF